MSNARVTISKANRECTHESCGAPVSKKGLCNAHYLRWYRGDQSITPTASLSDLSLEDRVKACVLYVDADSGCWVGSGKGTHGYTMLKINGKSYPNGHRFSYEVFKGEIPEGLYLDHTCRNRACINPDHLEPVTAKENVRRGLCGVLKETCANGHAWNDQNTKVAQSGKSKGVRYCNICKQEQGKKVTEKKRKK